MAEMKQITCECGCGRQRKVRVVDLGRGWGRFFDKSCKARHQARGKGFRLRSLQFESVEDQMGKFANGHLESGYFGHGQE